jgi:homocysteine S-methyltransferase
MPDKAAFKQLLQQATPIIIDGGLATQLEARGCNLDHPLWSASIISSNPQQIVDAHRAYLDAGAQVIVSASYQAIDSDLVAAATDLALRARDEFVVAQPRHPVPLVAASIGPYGATLGDGSEYTGSYDKNCAQLVDFHRPRLQQLDASDADVLACETIPSLVESHALCTLLASVTTPAWVSFCCRNGEQISDGARIEDAVQIFRDHPAVQAIGVNCTSPLYVATLIERIKNVLPDMPVLVYPNSGEAFDITDRTWSGIAKEEDWVRAAESWVAAGAKVIGGCCRIGPQHIQALRRVHA